MTLSLTTFSITMKLCDTQDNSTEHNDPSIKASNKMLSVVYAECLVFGIFMLNVVMLNVVMLNVVIPNVVAPFNQISL